MYGICCVLLFFRKNICHAKILFFKSFPKKTLRLWISKIRIWIWSEESTLSVDFMDSWSVFRFAQKDAKSVFGFGNPDLDFPKNTHPWKNSVLFKPFSSIRFPSYSMGTLNFGIHLVGIRKWPLWRGGHCREVLARFNEETLRQKDII